MKFNDDSGCSANVAWILEFIHFVNARAAGCCVHHRLDHVAVDMSTRVIGNTVRELRAIPARLRHDTDHTVVEAGACAATDLIYLYSGR